MASYYDEGGAIGSTDSDAPDTRPTGGMPAAMDLEDNSPAIPVEDDSTGVDQAAQNQAQPAPVAATQSPGANGGPLNPMNVPANAKRIVSYLMGADAAHPQTIDQVGAQVDPEGKLSEADRNLLAIQHVQETQGDNAAWHLMQANRVAYQGKVAAAKVALQGTPQKPADLNYAIDAANKAQANVLDGSNVQFAPSQGGVTATVTDPGGQPRKINLTIPQFSQFLDVGGDGQWDKIMDASSGATLDRIAGTGGANGAQPAAAAAAPQVGAPALATTRGTGLIGSPRQTDDTDKPYPGQTLDQGTNYGNELQARADAMFGKGKVYDPARQEWLAGQEEKELERDARVNVAKQQGINAVNTMQARNQGLESVAGTRADAWKYASDAKVKSAVQAALSKVQQQEAISGRNQQTIQERALAAQVSTQGVNSLNAAQLERWNALTSGTQSATTPAAAQRPVAQPPATQPTAAPAQSAPQQVKPARAQLADGKFYIRGLDGKAQLDPNQNP